MAVAAGQMERVPVFSAQGSMALAWYREWYRVGSAIKMQGNSKGYVSH
jgi:hypothetical protein